MKKEDIMEALTQIEDKWIEETAPLGSEIDKQKTYRQDAALIKDLEAENDSIPADPDRNNGSGPDERSNCGRRRRYRAWGLSAAACLVVIAGLYASGLVGSFRKGESTPGSTQQENTAAQGEQRAKSGAADMPADTGSADRMVPLMDRGEAAPEVDAAALPEENADMEAENAEQPEYLAEEESETEEETQSEPPQEKGGKKTAK